MQFRKTITNIPELYLARQKRALKGKEEWRI